MQRARGYVLGFGVSVFLMLVLTGLLGRELFLFILFAGLGTSAISLFFFYKHPQAELNFHHGFFLEIGPPQIEIQLNSFFVSVFFTFLSAIILFPFLNGLAH